MDTETPANTLVTDNDGIVTFTLSHNQSKALTVPDGAMLVIAETVPTGYTSSAASTQYSDSDTTDNTFTINSVATDGTITFTNTKGANLTITKTVTGDMGDTTKAFTFAVTGLPSGESYSYTKQYTTDGTTWMDVTGGTGTLTSSDNTFTLTHRQRIVIEALPLNTALTIVETNGNYTTTWKLGSETATTGNSKTITLTGDATLAVTNNLPAVAPTGVDFRILPYLLMLGAGLLLIPVLSRRKRRREEE